MKLTIKNTKTSPKMQLWAFGQHVYFTNALKNLVEHHTSEWIDILNLVL